MDSGRARRERADGPDLSVGSGQVRHLSLHYFLTPTLHPLSLNPCSDGTEKPLRKSGIRPGGTCQLAYK